jgi:hypothetical protein
LYYQQGLEDEFSWLADEDFSWLNDW